jgi:tetratricopeptide (TPR) repeat protein
MRNTKYQRGPFLRGTLAFLAVLAMGFGATACDFLDPTDVENPRTTEEDLAQALEPTAALLPGLEAQFARLLESAVVATECVSDNYSINGTGIDNSWDSPSDVTPTIANSDMRVTGVYWNAQELKALANFVIEDIIPDDDTATPEDIDRAHYYRGMAYLFLGEDFSYAPVEEDGAALPADQILELAVADLANAAAGGSEAAVPARAALARAYRWLGSESSAAAAANQVLGADPDFLLLQEYDPTSIDNTAHWYLVSRALSEMQPLPRLDFLDPKYLTYEAGIPVAKAEEMHLILAEIALAGSDYTAAKGHLGDAIRLAQSRSTESFVDPDARNNADLTIRPRDPEIRVRADAESPYRAGLVQGRFDGVDGRMTTQYVVSGTSLNPDSVEALPNGDPDAIWHAFYLARQEILFLEGRRMADLGIRLPMMLREVDQNPTISAGDPGTESVVPSYLPPSNQLDLFSPASPYDADTGVLITTLVTIRFDMNKILLQNHVSPFM